MIPAPAAIDKYIATLGPAARAKLAGEVYNYQSFRNGYRKNPAAFVEQCFDWSRVKDRPCDYQLEALTDLFATKPFVNKLALRGPRGLGKTTIAAWAVLFFGLTREGDPSRDWKIITLAGTGKQLTAFLWPEIKKWARLIDWKKVGRPAFGEGSELLEVMIKLHHGRAETMSPKDPDLVEGAHAESMLYIFDESKSIIQKLFDATEGAFSGAGPETGREAFALAISTPGEPVGRFHAICTKQAGLEDWMVKHVTKERAIAAKRISLSWCEQRKRQWGERSQLYQNHVMGEFAAGQADGVIPLAWLELAHDRWRAMFNSDTLPKPKRWPPEAAGWTDEQKAEDPQILLSTIGVDCSYGGADKSTIAELCGVVITRVEQVLVEADNMPTIAIATAVQDIQGQRAGVAIVDVVGTGGGVVDQLRKWKAAMVPFSAGSKAMRRGKPATDVTGTLGFGCLRDAAWWHLRELLDPANGYEVAIPPDEFIPAVRDAESSLTAELLAPKWDRDMTGQKIRVESKDDLRKPDRLGRSTDWADAVVQAFARDLIGSYRAPGDIGMS